MSHKPIFVLLLMLGAAGVATLGAAQAAKLNEELPAGRMQQKATTACLECHEARIILQQRLNKATWTKEVDKMVKWGAVVDPNDRDALIDYLSTNFGPEQAGYTAIRTSSEKNSNSQGAQRNRDNR
jgi:mono/diheme cytochrome c family protein